MNKKAFVLCCEIRMLFFHKVFEFKVKIESRVWIFNWTSSPLHPGPPVPALSTALESSPTSRRLLCPETVTCKISVSPVSSD